VGSRSAGPRLGGKNRNYPAATEIAPQSPPHLKLKNSPFTFVYLKTLDWLLGEEFDVSTPQIFLHHYIFRFVLRTHPAAGDGLIHRDFRFFFEKYDHNEDTLRDEEGRLVFIMHTSQTY